MKLLLFDIDMTLVSTGGAGIRALGRAFETVCGSRDALRDVRPHGKTDPAIIREALGRRGIEDRPETRSRILECYVSFLEGEVAASENYRVLPGVGELLDELAVDPNVVMGLATGNIEAGARIKLERGGLNGYFGFGGFGSDSQDRTALVRKAAMRAEERSGRPIAPCDILVVGDTPMDVAAGRGAGFATVAVATGTYGIRELVETGADCVIPDLVAGRIPLLRSAGLGGYRQEDPKPVR